MAKRTEKEIASEITALKPLKPVPGPFQQKTQRSIELAIEELEFGVDDTADEWNDLSDEQQDIVNTARNWKDGFSTDKPSEGWGLLVK